MRRFFFAAVFLLLTVVPSLCAPAREPGYTVQVLQTEQGLPQNNINSIVQTREGYLWIATLGGLVRFDGVRFKTFDSANAPQLQNSRVTALFEDRNGALWIGHETGDLTRLSNGRFEAVTIPGPPKREPIIAITEGHGTPMLFYQSAAIRSLQTGALILPETSAEQQRGIAVCVRDNSGALWILRAGALSRLAGDKIVPAEFDPFAADKMVYGIGAARDGGLWVAGAGRIRKRLNDQWTQEFSALPWRTTAIPAMLEMRNGNLAVATFDEGIFIIRKNDIQRLDRNDALPYDWVRTLCEDHEGNLWVGLANGGLVALRPARAEAVAVNPREDRWKGRPVLSVAATQKDDLWFGTQGAGLYRFFAGAAVPFASERGPSTNAIVLSFAEDDSRRVWVSTADNGLYVYGNGAFQQPAGLENFLKPVRALFHSRTADAVFLGANDGLYRYDTRAQTLQTFATNLLAPDIRCIAEQTNGILWFGMFGGGLGRLQNGVATQLTKTNGLSSDFVQALHLDADNTLWIGTAESGLSRYKDGRFSSINTSHGLRDNVICRIADDLLGYLWISSRNGIMRVAKSDLNRCANGALASFQCLSFGETDGLPSAQCSGGLQPTGCRTSDGRLWFATARGAVSIDPANIRTNQLPLVIIEELRVNDTPIARASTSTSIPPGRQRFDFDYTAISFAAPARVLFKYRLEGLEQDWVGPTAKRTVSYSHLAPGDYKFHLIACNSDGVWNESSATLAFTVLPFFWQTLPFRLAVTFAALGLVAAAALLVSRRRYHRRLELAEQQRALERERTRIAQDIHDDLGSSLTRIILLSQSARGDLDSPEVAAVDLDRIYDTARNLTRSLDEIVWAVNPRHDTLDSLATYLGKFAQDFLGAANIRCRLDLPVAVPSWPLRAETRHNVFLAFKEALNNAVKHAQPTEVRIALALELSAFTLTVEDNGRGFDPAKQNADTEDGLRNMRKRLTDIGGSCQIHSQPAQGSRIRFHVPVAS